MDEYIIGVLHTAVCLEVLKQLCRSMMPRCHPKLHAQYKFKVSEKEFFYKDQCPVNPATEGKTKPIANQINLDQMSVISLIIKETL